MLTAGGAKVVDSAKLFSSVTGAICSLGSCMHLNDKRLHAVWALTWGEHVGGRARPPVVYKSVQGYRHVGLARRVRYAI